MPDPGATVAPVAAPPLPVRPGAEVVLPDRAAERRAAVRRVERQERLRAALEGVAGEAPGDGPVGGGAPGAGEVGGDPALALWKGEAEAVFREAFHPPPGDHSGRVAQVQLAFDPESGAVRGATVHSGSGSATFDAAALRAVGSVPALPPPPARWREMVGSALLVDFVPP